MASRMRKRSVLSTPSRADCTEFRYCTRPIAARIEIRLITMRSSTRVKPRSRVIADCRVAIADWILRTLPVLVLSAVKRFAVRLREDVEHVAAAPRRGVGLVRIGAHPPLRRSRDGINRNPAEELQLHPSGVVVLGDAVDE